MTVAIPFSEVGRVHQYANVAAGESKRIFYLKVPHKSVAFLYFIGNNFFIHTYWKWYIDGMEVEKTKIKRQIAAIGTPRKYDPPFLVKNYIEWVAYNNDVEAHCFEIMNDGVIISIRRN